MIKTFDTDPRGDHERWTMTTSLLSPHERIPSISVLAGTNEGFEWEREGNEIPSLHLSVSLSDNASTQGVLFIEPLVWASS